ASLATIMHSWPWTRPMPAIIPAAGASPSYMPRAASWPISRNGAPASSSPSTRSRGRSLPRATCRSRDLASPPSATSAARARRSSAWRCSEAALPLNSSERVSMRDLIAAMALSSRCGSPTRELNVAARVVRTTQCKPALTRLGRGRKMVRHATDPLAPGHRGDTMSVFIRTLLRGLTAFAVALPFAATAQAPVTLHGAVQFNDDHAFNKSLLKFEELVKKYYGK